MREKNQAQLNQIMLVQQAVEAAMAAVVEYLSTEHTPTAEEAHAIIDTVLAQHGCESPEGHIVSAGAGSVEPHEKGQGAIEKGVPIVIDIYPRSIETGYYADMTRTVCIGEAAPALQQLYDTVLEGQQLALSLLAPGVACTDIQKAVHDYFNKQGYQTSGTGTEFVYAEGFVHAIGHGVGQEVHEAPNISLRSNDVLEVGDVITIEPGLYYKELGGVRIEDMLHITAGGYVNMSTFPKTFVI